MSNAKYRTPVHNLTGATSIAITAASADAEKTPTSERLLEFAKGALGYMLKDAEKSLREGRLSVKDALAATKQVIAIARLEQRQRGRAERAAAGVGRASSLPGTLATDREVPPVRNPEPEPSLAQKADAFARATADNPTDPVPILLGAG